MPVLPDILDHGLKVVFCGSAVGTKSAEVGAYYAGPGNRFWPMLFETGLTPRLLAPREGPGILAFGIGLTDMAKTASGADASLPKDADDPEALRVKIARFQPRALAFNGKRAAKVFLGRAGIEIGRQPESIRLTTVFVLPSTSGMARRYWDQSPWFELAEFVKSP